MGSSQALYLVSEGFFKFVFDFEEIIAIFN